MRKVACGFGVMLSVVFAPVLAGAAPLLDLSGQVALLDGAVPSGVRIVLGIDLDRDGELNSFETLNAKVTADGSYRLEYTPDVTKVDFEFIAFVADLAAEASQRGFDALLDGGPLPLVVRFEQEGYSTIVKRFSTLHDAPTLSVLMTPLDVIRCSDDACGTADGALEISGLTEGMKIARAYARAYDPALHPMSFPGTFTDDDDNLLISSGFTEINLHDESGKKITEVSSPVAVRLLAHPESYASLRDTKPNTDKIEVPMYSFDEERGQWITEAPGELQAPDGTPIGEDAFPSITRGEYDQPIYIAFRTKHFSTFNCDAPIGERSCVKGTLVREGKATAGVSVWAEGLSYVGTAGAVFTGEDGSFALDLMRSETAAEDVDRNGVMGETFTARLGFAGEFGVTFGEAFDTPRVQGTAQSSTSACQGDDCDCVDIGEVGDYEAVVPRLCDIRVRVTYPEQTRGEPGLTPADEDASLGDAGAAIPTAAIPTAARRDASVDDSNQSVLDGGLEPGDRDASVAPSNASDLRGMALGNVRVLGQFIGSMAAPGNPGDCGGRTCGSAISDDDGFATLTVKVVGNDARIELRADTTFDGTRSDHYQAELTIDACAEGETEVAGIVELEAKRVDSEPIDEYLERLAEVLSPLAEQSSRDGKVQNANSDCQCRTGAGTGGRAGSSILIACAGAGVLLARRRRGHGARGGGTFCGSST